MRTVKLAVLTAILLTNLHIQGCQDPIVGPATKAKTEHDKTKAEKDMKQMEINLERDKMMMSYANKNAQRQHEMKLAEKRNEQNSGSSEKTDADVSSDE